MQDAAGEPLYKLFRAIKHQIEKGPVDMQVKKAKYTLNDTGLLGDDVEYSMLVRARCILDITLIYFSCTSTCAHMCIEKEPVFTHSLCFVVPDPTGVGSGGRS